MLRPSHSSHLLLVVFVVLALGLLAGDALAFCRARACGGPGDPPCKTAADGCPASGTPIVWSSTRLPYAVTTTGSKRRRIDAKALRDAVARAFDLWRRADCGAGQQPAFDVVDAGPSRWDRHDGKDGENTFVFADDAWNFDSSLFAVTTQHWDKATGTTRDADVLLNSLEHALALRTETTTDVALNGVLAHEVGHFLGLAHSNVTSALMADSYEPTDTPALSADDVRGICAVFPPGRAVPGVRCVRPETPSTLSSDARPMTSAKGNPREASPTPAPPPSRDGPSPARQLGTGALFLALCVIAYAAPRPRRQPPPRAPGRTE